MWLGTSYSLFLFKPTWLWKRLTNSFDNVIVPKSPFLFRLRILSLFRKKVSSRTLQKLLTCSHNEKCVLGRLVSAASSFKRSAKSGLVVSHIYSGHSPSNANICLRTCPLISTAFLCVEELCALFRV